MSRNRLNLIVAVASATAVVVMFALFGTEVARHATEVCGQLFGDDVSRLLGWAMATVAALALILGGGIAAIASHQRTVFVASLIMAALALVAFGLGLALGSQGVSPC